MKKIKLVFGEQVEIREDVLLFAQEMSRAMDAKEAENPEKLTVITAALGKIDEQLRRIGEQIEHGGGISSDFPAIYRRVVHIANFAMIAHGLVKGKS